MVLLHSSVHAHTQHKGEILQRPHCRRVHRHGIYDSAMAVCIRTVICIQIQCDIRFVLFPAVASDLDATCMGDMPVGSTDMLCVAKHLPILIFRPNQRNICPIQGKSYFGRCRCDSKGIFRQSAGVESNWIVRTYGFPSRLVTDIIDVLMRIGVVSRVVLDRQRQQYAYAPALNPDTITVADLRTRLRTYGMAGFIPEFRNNFPGVVATIENMDKTVDSVYSKLLLKDIEINNSKGK